MTPGTPTRVSPGCCDGAEAERAPARRTSPITIPPAPAHRLLAQRRRVRSASAAPRQQSLASVVAWRASASQASAAARWSVAVVCASSATCAVCASSARTMAARRASRRCADLAPSFFAGAVTRRAVAQRRSRAHQPLYNKSEHQLGCNIQCCVWKPFNARSISMKLFEKWSPPIETSTTVRASPGDVA